MIVTIFAQTATSQTYHVRYITSAKCTSGEFKADKALLPRAVIGQTDFNAYTKAFQAQVIEKGKDGVIVFKTDGDLRHFCQGAIGATWVTIAYSIID